MTKRQAEAAWRATRTPSQGPSGKPVPGVARPAASRPSDGRILSALSRCGKLYAKTRVNPFDTEAGACVPDKTTRNTKRVKYWIKGTFTIGTGGFGFCMVDSSCVGETDNYCLVHTNSSYAGTFIDPAAIAPAITTLTTSNSVFVNADKGDIPGGGLNARSRIVGAGMRIKYAGTQLNVGGTAIGLQEPDNLSLEDMDFDQFAAYQETTTLAVNSERKWMELVWQPQDETDFEFTQLSNNTTGSGVMPPAVDFGFVVSGTAGDTYTYEYAVHMEWIGAVTDKTPSENDAVALAAVETVANRPEFVGGRYLTPKTQTQSFLHRVAKEVLSGVSGVGRFLVDHKGDIASLSSAILAFL